MSRMFQASKEFGMLCPRVMGRTGGCQFAKQLFGGQHVGQAGVAAVAPRVLVDRQLRNQPTHSYLIVFHSSSSFVSIKA